MWQCTLYIRQPQGKSEGQAERENVAETEGQRKRKMDKTELQEKCIQT